MAETVVQPKDEMERLSLFFPIKVVNGFVTCDFRVGCYCCKFCLNRRYPDWQRLLETKRVFRNTLQVEQAVRLLGRVKAFTQAKVTLKIGHDTDMSLEEPEAQRLVDLLPGEHPIVFMRRGKLLPEYKPFYLKRRPNLLLELTVTPRSAYLDYDIDPFETLHSFDGIACNMFYTVGPVCHDNFDEAKAVIRAIPTGSKVWVKALIIKDIPAYAAAKTNDHRVSELRQFAHERGLLVVDYLNCIVRAEVGLGFHKRGEFVSENNTWQLKWADECCKVRQMCGRELPEPEERAYIDGALKDLALTLESRPLKFGHKSYQVYVNEEINFGDECYLREITSLKIDLYKTGRKTGTSISESIEQRWRAQDFFPVDEMLQLARESYQIAFGE